MPDQPNSVWRQRLSEAAALFQARRLADAAALLEPHLGEPEAPYQAHGLAGLITQAAGDHRQALDHLRRAVTMAPDDVPQRYNLGVVFRECGEGDEAERVFRHILDTRADHVPATTQLADLLNAAGRFDEAVEVCRRFLRVAAPEPTVLLALAEAYRLGGQWREAAGVLEEAGTRWPREPRIPARLGVVRRAQGRLEEAVRCYEAALVLRPAHPPTLNNLGLALLSLGQLDRARQSFERALERDPGLAEARLNRAAVLARQGRRGEALKEARRVAATEPERGRAQSAVAALLSGERDPDALLEAETAARRALALDERDAVGWDSLGILLIKRGETEAAFRAGQRAIELAPSEVDYWLHFADSLARGLQLERAEAVLKAALERHAAAPEVHRQLGIVLLRRGRYEEALARLDRCLAVRSADQRAIAHKALALECLGRIDEAVELLGLDRFIRRFRIENVAPFDSVTAFNRQLAADIRGHPTLRWEPVGLAASGGALTGELLAAPTDAIRVFERELRRAIDEFRESLEPGPGHPFLRHLPGAYRLNTWATLVPEQGEISAHIHEESWLSGAYYAELPEAMGADRAARAGWIEFGRPSAELPGVPDDALRWVRPEEGLLLLFPSYLFHRTLPFDGAGERISMSFDLIPVDD